jgi:hypothetical protein
VFPGSVYRTLLRRWYLVLLGLALTAWLPSMALRYVSPTYTLESQVLLLPPETAVLVGDNPYLNLGGLGSIGDVVSRAVGDDDTRRYVQNTTGVIDYTVDLDRSAAAPIVLTTVESTSAASTEAAMKYLQSQLKVELRRVQIEAGVKPEALVAEATVTKMDQVRVSHKDQYRAAGVAAAGGLAATVLLIAAVDAALMARRRRKAERAESDAAAREAAIRDASDDHEALSAPGTGAAPRTGTASDTDAGPDDEPHPRAQDPRPQDPRAQNPRGRRPKRRRPNGSAANGSAANGSAGNGIAANGSTAGVGQPASEGEPTRIPGVVLPEDARR